MIQAGFSFDDDGYLNKKGRQAVQAVLRKASRVKASNSSVGAPTVRPVSPKRLSRSAKVTESKGSVAHPVKAPAAVKHRYPTRSRGKLP